MKNKITAAFAVLLFTATAAYAAAPRGPVHNEKAAILMARRIWMNLYPADVSKVGSEKAWLETEKATRDGDIWEVGPKNPSPTSLGNGIVYRIDSSDGHMMGFYNTQ